MGPAKEGAQQHGLSRRDLLMRGAQAGIVAATAAVIPQAVLGAERRPQPQEDPRVALNRGLVQTHAQEIHAREEAGSTFVPVGPGDIYRFGDQSKPDVFIAIHDLVDPDEFKMSLDIAKQYPGTRFTYAPIGNLLVEGSADARQRVKLINRAYREGHRFINHTYTHPDMTTLTLDQKINEVLKGHRALQDALCMAWKDIGFTPPYWAGAIWGEYDSEVIQTGQLLNLGIPTTSKDSQGWNWATVPQILDNVLPLANGDIVTIHANGKRNDIPAALPKILDAGIKAGMRFKTITPKTIPQNGTGL